MKKVFLALLCLFAVSNVNAATLTVDGGWSTFTFDAVGSSWSDTFEFTLTESAVLKVTDAFMSGDVFEFTDGSSIWLTSTPTSEGDQINSDYDAAFADDRWSSLAVLLSAGTYTISGTAAISPFGSGGAAISLSSVSAVPVPAALYMFVPGLMWLFGMGRKSKAV